MTSSFLAIDFETAEPKRDSACAVGAVLVRGTEIAECFTSLIRPPRDKFWGPCIGKHGIHWDDVKDEQPFGAVWPRHRDAATPGRRERRPQRVVRPQRPSRLLRDPWHPPAGPRVDLQLARNKWSLPSASLADVCTSLGIALDHHEPGSDAEACARILIADRNGTRPDPMRAPAKPRRPSRPVHPLRLHRSEPVAPHAGAALAVQQLIGICQGICADQRIVHAEFDLLFEWLQAHEALYREYPVDLISLEVARILEDGCVTEQELEALRYVLGECVGPLERFGV